MTKGWCLLLCCVTETVALYCLSCTESVSPRHCHSVMNCGDGEVCFTESHLTRNGIVVFNTGCRTLQTCQTKRNNVLNRNGLYRVVPHTHCLECCSTDLCNSKGCGKPGYPLTRGPACFDCQQISKPMLCDQISICDQNEECYLQREYEFDDVYYSSRCINKHTCALNPEVFGKRNTDHCSHCCSTDLCNNKCSNSSLQTNATTTPTILTGQDTPQGLGQRYQKRNVFLFQHLSFMS
uniref:Uncharacterized protein LOC111115546 isoform X4 n=1 Tax=Crassostrea virginica TaxID=6565 RepID=A0A8B8C525_CRAVI|nr:uncharacterized protein LOC111115546 isoform X4 [Crassostrea virginica]